MELKSKLMVIFFLFQDGTFGGSFREQIYLATLPECCYEELLHIFEAFKNGHIPTTR